MFALAARSFGQASETFIRLHAERIAPNQSVYISFDKAPDAALPGPLMHSANTFAGVENGDQPFRSLPSAIPFLRHRQIARFLKHHNVTHMMSEFGPFGYKLLPAAKMAGCKYFVHFLGWDASRVIKDPKILKKYAILFRQADGFFTPSQFLADNLIGIGCPKEKITVTPCGVVPEDLPLSSRQPGKMLAVGRFVEKKAPHITIAAFAKVARKHPKAHLDFVGDGKLLDRCKTIAQEAGIADQITFHGTQSHSKVHDLMAEASLFLQHSVTASTGDTEGLPVAILEAMCAGNCVISTRHSGIPEAVIDKECGFLTDEHDVNGMAAAIDAALADPKCANTYGDAARIRAIDLFSADRSIKLLQQKMGLQVHP